MATSNKIMKYSVGVALIGVIITVITAFANIQQTGNEWRINQIQTGHKIEKKVEVLCERVDKLERIAGNQRQKINDLTTISSNLNGQFENINKVLSRLDERTKRLESYFFKRSQKDSE